MVIAAPLGAPPAPAPDSRCGENPQLGFARDFVLRSTRSIPADVATLASAQPGHVVEVRAVLCGAGDSAALLRPGDLLTVRSRTSEWFVVDLNGRGEVAVHRHDARLVRIERGFADGVHVRANHR